MFTSLKSVCLAGAMALACPLFALAGTYTIQGVGLMGVNASGRGETQATHISDNGIVGGLGYQFNTSGSSLGQRGFIWSDGTLQSIEFGAASNGSSQSQVNYVSASGVVVGFGRQYVNGTSVGDRGFIWKDGVMTMLGDLGTDANGVGRTTLFLANENGMAIGSATKYVNGAVDGSRGIVWNGGVLHEIPSLASYSRSSEAADINSSGVVAAITRVSTSSGGIYDRAARWENGVTTILADAGIDFDGQTSSWAYKINTASHIVGYTSIYDDSHAYQGTRGALWVGNSLTLLDGLGTSSEGRQISYAYDINDGGHIIGQSYKHDDNHVNKGPRGVRWKEGEIHEMGTLAADAGGRGYSNVWRINAVGEVIGTTRKYSATGQSLGDRATFMDLDGNTIFLDFSSSSTGSGFSRPQVLLDDGTVFGDYYKYENGTFVGHFAFVWSQEDGLTDLNDLVDNLTSEGWVRLEYIGDVNSLGQIVGYGLRADGSREGFILTLPEPGSLAMLALPLAILLRRRR